MSVSLRPVAIGLVCILALSLAAATLTTPVEHGGGFGDGGGTDAPPPESSDVEQDPAVEPIDAGPTQAIPRPCIEALLEYRAMTWLLLGLVAAGAIAAKLHSPGVGVSIVALGFLPIIFGVLLLTAGCGAEATVAEEAANATYQGVSEAVEGEDGGDGGGQPVTAPSIAIVGFVVLAVLGFAIALFARSQDEDVEPEPASDASPDPRRTIGTVAGEAADRIEDDADLDNEIYRAWSEMTEALAVDRPETSTPAEFAAAAVDAGLDAGDVGELTDLFETVRYGTAEVTPERERRAVDALRRIERQYADADVDAAPPADSDGTSSPGGGSSADPDGALDGPDGDRSGGGDRD